MSPTTSTSAMIPMREASLPRAHRRHFAACFSGFCRKVDALDRVFGSR